MRDQFTFYRSFWEAVKEIEKPRDRLSLLEAIIAFALDEDEREVTKTARSSFILCKPTLISSAKKATAGKKGGMAKQTASKTEANDKQTASEKEKEVEGEKEKEIENECSIKETNKEKSGGVFVLKAAMLPENQRFYEGRG